MGLFDGALGALLSGSAGASTPGGLGGLLGGLAGAAAPQAAGAGAGAGASAGGGTDPMLAIALSVMQQQGGLAGLVGALQRGGLGEHAASWVGTGANQPVSGAQLASALGPDTIGAIASRLGVPHGQASDGLAAVLPQLVNHMTPSGQVPGNHADIVSAALSMLGGAAR